MCRWLIIANWFCVLCRFATNSRANLDHRHFCSERRTSCRVNAQDVVFSKIDETAKTRTLEREERSSRRSTSIQSNREFSENSWRYRSLSRKYFDVFLSTTLIFSDRRLEAIDRTKYQWECVRCLRSLVQIFSRRHHDRFSFFCEEKVSRRRSRTCFVWDRFRFEVWNEKERKRERKEEREEENERKKKERKKNENDEIVVDDEKNDVVDVRIVQIAVNKQLEV